MPTPKYLRIGHKGADAIEPGNTLESFDAAVEVGVDMIEFDVLRDRDERLVVAHDFHDASVRRPLALSEALDAFCEPPLDKVEIDCDLKLPGREAELAGALAGRGLIERAMVSTMEVESLVKLPQARARPAARLDLSPRPGATGPAYRWAAPGDGRRPDGASAPVPEDARRAAPPSSAWTRSGPTTSWSRRSSSRPPTTLRWTSTSGLWTTRSEIAELDELGVHGIVSNDPRLFKAEAPAPAKDDGKPDKRRQEGRQAQQEGSQEDRQGACRGSRAHEAEAAKS